MSTDQPNNSMTDRSDRLSSPAGVGRARAFAACLLAVGLASAAALAQDGDAGESTGASEPEVLLDWGDEKPASQPAVNPDRRRGGRMVPPPAEPTVQIPSLSDPMELTTLIDFVGATLNLNIVVNGTPTGEIVFNAPVEVPLSKLLDLLDAMLEQYDYTVTFEPATGFYVVQPIADVRPTLRGERSSVRIIPTPNIKPSQIASTLSTLLGASAGGGQGGQGGQGGGSSSIQAVDELGVLIVNAPSRDIARVEEMVEELMRIDGEQQYIRLELNHIAAPAALERAIGLVGAASGGSGQGGLAAQLAIQNRRNEGNNAFAPGGSASGTFSNLADRITVDPQGNALIFRGTPGEIERVRGILALIDVPNKLQPKSYFAGSAAAQIADIASRSGFGEVVQVNNDNGQGQGGIFGQFNQRQGGGLGTQSGQGQDESLGGPVMVVDISKGRIIYYGTDEQQEQLAVLMEELRTEDERVVLRNYVLNHSDAEAVADLITTIITGERQTGDSPLLPTRNNVNNQNVGRAAQILSGLTGGGPGDDVSAAFDPDIVTVTADIDNNQVIVKAPIKQQEELEKLITILDRRRAQVYIEAMIVSVSDDESFTLAFESQFLSGEFGVNTNFGLGSFGTGGMFTDVKQVGTGLSGLTGSLIRSDYIPLIINATQTNGDTRILSTPQLLVNDNEESEIVSLSEEPFSEITQTDGQEPLQGFGGFAEAGTTLRVTPSISEGGFLRLEYYVELSNFTDTSGSDGNPPPRDRNTIEGAVTVPSDSTIIIGGITVDNVRNSVVKVPLLGDIPLLGELFKRTDKIDTSARLYIFLTPRIMTDPNFNDLKLMTNGPQAEMAIDGATPRLEPLRIRSVGQGTRLFGEPDEGESLAPVLAPEQIESES